MQTQDFSNILTPLLIFHFVFCVEGILQQGLKKDYIVKKENFCAKINKALCHFDEVSTVVGKRKIEIKKYGKLHKYYPKAMELAKKILKLEEVGIVEQEKESSKDFYTPEFWIDMSRLYEVYVYTLLEEAYQNEIKFQVKGYGGDNKNRRETVVDFIHTEEKVILDAKYKPQKKEARTNLLDNVRQLSAYARDEKILSELGIEQGTQYIPPCVVICPPLEQDSSDETHNVFKKVTRLMQVVNDEGMKIEGFKDFYKICVPLSMI